MLRSSWEYSVARYLDENAHVLAWSSEPVSIPYRNPLTGKHTIYVPDFLVVYERNGKKFAEMIEVKPAKEVPGMIVEKKMSPRTKAAQIVNAAKWQAAIAFCNKRHIKFRVLTEVDLYLFKRTGK